MSLLNYHLLESFSVLPLKYLEQLGKISKYLPEITLKQENFPVLLILMLQHLERDKKRVIK